MKFPFPAGMFPQIPDLPAPASLDCDDTGPLDLTTMLYFYSVGIFPMARDDGLVEWCRPTERAVIPLGGLHVSRSLARHVRRKTHEVATDADFPAVVAGCAARERTWISGELAERYCELHERGFFHSVEARRDGRLVGGLFGLALGSAFFGESMFSLDPDASKACLVNLVARLNYGGFRLLDAQYPTPHLHSLGARILPNEVFMTALFRSIPRKASFEAMPEDLCPLEVLRLARGWSPQRSPSRRDRRPGFSFRQLDE